MKKRKTSDNSIAVCDDRHMLNPVAKFAGRFNKAKVIADKNAYSRKAKHVKREQEVSPSVPN